MRDSGYNASAYIESWFGIGLKENCTSIKPREPDLLLVVERTQEPQERWPDGYRRIPYGGKTLA